MINENDFERAGHGLSGRSRDASKIEEILKAAWYRKRSIIHTCGPDGMLITNFPNPPFPALAVAHASLIFPNSLDFTTRIRAARAFPSSANHKILSRSPTSSFIRRHCYLKDHRTALFLLKESTASKSRRKSHRARGIILAVEFPGEN